MNLTKETEISKQEANDENSSNINCSSITTKDEEAINETSLTEELLSAVEETKESKVENSIIKKPKDKHIFADHMCYDKLFWIFLIGAFAGTVVETVFCVVVHGYIENRSGILYLPFNPVYGFGAVAMAVCLEKVKEKHILWIFVATAFLGSFVEFICSLFQELVFGTVSWEYSNSFLSIGGRTNFIFGIFWGILGVVWIKWIYPFMCRIIEKIPNKIGKSLTIVLTVVLVFDMLLSCLALYRETLRRDNIPPKTQLGVFLDKAYPNEYLKKVYPNMKIKKENGEVGLLFGDENSDNEVSVNHK